MIYHGIPKLLKNVIFQMKDYVCAKKNINFESSRTAFYKSDISVQHLLDLKKIMRILIVLMIILIMKILNFNFQDFEFRTSFEVLMNFSTFHLLS